MTIGDKNISGDFTAQAESYRNGQTIFLIDGSGSMPAAYGGGENPVNTAVSYAIDVKNNLNPAALAFFFSEERRDMVPILLEAGEDPMRRFPQGPGYLLPALEGVKAGTTKADMRKLHLVIVSDGEISEYQPEEQARVRDMLEHFLAAGSTIDVIMPGRGGQTHFSRLLQEMSAKGAAPNLYLAPSAEELPVCMAQAINGRTGGKALFENAQREAVQGLDKPAKVMSTLKIRKPVVE